jgi:lipopolysaccharide transport system permease protein
VKLINEIWSYKDLLKLLVSRDIKLKYRRSVLGYVWSILNPLLIMSVMAVVFSTMFKRNIEHFPVYLFCGQLLFNFMNNSTHQAIYSITANSALLKKTYVPRYIFTVSKITSGMVDFVFSLGALLIVMLVTGSGFSWYFLLFPFVVLQLYLFCVGMGLFLAQANVFFRDIQYIYNAVTTAWMYLTPIFYPIDALPEMLQWGIKHFNPMYFYVAQFRDLVWQGRMPGWGIIGAGSLAAVLALVLGIWSFSKSQDKFILYI